MYDEIYEDESQKPRQGIGSIESVLKKMADQSRVVLRATIYNIKILLENLERNRKGQGSTDKEDQGPSKQTQANMKKVEESKEKELDELKALAANMNILVEQAVDLLKTMWLSQCWSLAIFLWSFFSLLSCLSWALAI